MTLTTHAIVGAAVASVIPTFPILGISLAFVSHFIIDAIPHLDYAIASDSVNPSIGAPIRFDRRLVRDALTIGSDAFLGLALALALFATSAQWWVIFLAACAAILPDPLQLVYAHFRHEPLVSLQRFHQWIHTDHRMKHTPWLGFLSQIAFMVIVVSVAKMMN